MIINGKCELCGCNELHAINGYHHGCPSCTEYVEQRFARAGLSCKQIEEKEMENMHKSIDTKEFQNVLKTLAYLQTLAQTGYEGYCEFTGWKSAVTAAPLPPWKQLPDVVKNAWMAAAQKMISN